MAISKLYFLPQSPLVRTGKGEFLEIMHKPREGREYLNGLIRRSSALASPGRDYMTIASSNLCDNELANWDFLWS